LLQFLGSVTEFPHLARLSQLNPYDDTPIEGEWLAGLLHDIEELLSNLKMDERTITVPNLVGDPPSGNAPPEPFDIQKFIFWLRELKHLAQRAYDSGIPLIAYGD